MPLTDAQIEYRTNRIGGSDARRLAEGDAYTLWKEKKGLEQPENLDGVLPVQMGVWTEPHHIDWFCDRFGYVDRERQAVFACKDNDQLFATVDAILVETDTEVPDIIECKHVNAFTSFDQQIEKYYPQLQHIMMCSGQDRIIFSVFIGTMKWEWQYVSRDDVYIEELRKLEETFLEYLKLDEWPGVLPEPPATPNFVRSVNMEEGNRAGEWQQLADEWKRYKHASSVFDQTKKAIKDILPDDAKEAYGFGIVATRAKNGAVTIKEKPQ